MPKAKFVFCICLLFLFCPSYVYPSAIEIDECIDTTIVDIVPSSMYLAIKSEINPDALDLSFFQKSPDSISLNPNLQYAISYSVNNLSGDSLECVLYCSRIINGDLYVKEKGNYIFINNTGNGILRLNEFGNEGEFIRFKVPPNKTNKYVFIFQPFPKKRNLNFQIWGMEKFDEHFSKIKKDNLFKRIFQIVIFFMALLMTVFFIFSKLEGVKYYVLYLLSVLLMYIRKDPLFFGMFGDLQEDLFSIWSYTESIAGYLMMLFYLLFITVFLDFKNHFPKADRVCNLLISAYFFFVATDIFIKLWGNHVLSEQIFRYSRLFSMTIFTVIILSSIRNYHIVLFRYILFGTFLFVFPYIFTLLSDLSKASDFIKAHDFIKVVQMSNEGELLYRRYYWNGVVVPIYRPKVGIILEVFFFTAGLAHLYSKNLKDYKTLSEELQAKERLLDKIKDTEEKSKTTELKEKVSLPSLSGYEIIAVNDIIYISKYDNKCRVYLKGGEIKDTSKTLSEIIKLLPLTQFMRIHHSVIINLSTIVQYIPGDGGYVVLINNDKLKVSRANKEKLKEWLNL